MSNSDSDSDSYDDIFPAEYNESAREIMKAIDEGFASSGLSKNEYYIRHAIRLSNDAVNAALRFKNWVRLSGDAPRDIEKELNVMADKLLANVDTIRDIFECAYDQQVGGVESKK